MVYELSGSSETATNVIIIMTDLWDLRKRTAAMVDSNRGELFVLNCSKILIQEREVK